MRLWEGESEFFEFGNGDGLDVAVVGVVFHVVLVVGFGFEKSIQGLDLGGDGVVDFAGVLVGLLGSLDDGFFLGIGVEDDGAVLRAEVGGHAVAIGDIMGGPEEVDEFAKAGFFWVVGDFHSLGMGGEACGNFFVCGIGAIAAGVATDDFDDAGLRLEIGLDTPEAASAEDELFLLCGRCGLSEENDASEQAGAVFDPGECGHASESLGVVMS